MKKRVVALILSAVMTAAAVTACGTAAAAVPAANETEEVTAAAEEATAAEEKAPAEETAAADEETASAEEAAAEWEGGIDEINILLYDLYGVGEKSGDVVNKMNEITEQTIGVHANISWSTLADYATTASLALSSGEQLDVISIIPIDPVSFTSMIANQQLMDITEYMEEEGAETLDQLQDYIASMSVGGQIYGVPCFRSYASGVYIVLRRDILEELGLTDTAVNMTKWSEYEDILKTVYEEKQGSNLAPLGSTSWRAGLLFPGDEFAVHEAYDTLNDSLNVVYSDKEGNVSFLLDNKDYRNEMERIRNYWNAGYVYKDAITSDEHPDTLTKAGIVFSTVQNGELGLETTKTEATGYEQLCVELGMKQIDSSQVNKFGLGVPVTAQEPEAAVRWINAIWTNPELENLLVWGIEGVDYVVEDGEADFPEGLTSDTVNYHNAYFMYGNFFNAHPWKGQGKDFNERSMEYLKSAEVSPYMGFTADQSSLDNIMAGLSSVYQEYNKRLSFGAWTDDEWDEYYAKLKTAGVDEYLDSIQNQLNDFLGK